MDVIIRLSTNPVELLLTGTRDDKAKRIVISGIKVSGKSEGFSGTAALTLATAVDAPLIALKEIKGEYLLRTPQEANEIGAAGPLADLRRTLAAQSILISTKTFFGLPGGGSWVDGLVSITLPLASQGTGKIAIEAKARTAIRADLALTNHAQVTIAGYLALRVLLYEDDIQATLETIFPETPDLGFSLRDLTLPSLSFDGASLVPDAFSVLNIPLPDWLSGLVTVSGGKPFGVGVNGEDFILTADSTVNVIVASAPALTVKDFRITKTGDTLKIEGEVSTKGDIAINKTFDFGGVGSPVRGALTLGKASFKLDTTRAEITWIVTRLSIEAADDPGSRLVVALKLTSITTLANGKTTWNLIDPKVLDIGGEIHVPGIDFIDGRIRLRMGALKGKAEVFLRRMLRLIAAIVRYLGKKIGPIPGLLSDLAEALADLLADGLQQLFNLLDATDDYVTLELRLDAATLRPVQLIVTLRSALGREINVGGSLLKVHSSFEFVPSLVLDLEHNWQGLALLYEPDEYPNLTVSTNLWLEPATGSTSAIPELKDKKEDPLVALKAAMSKNRTIVVAALQHGRAKFFQTFGEDRKTASDINLGGIPGKISAVGPLTDLEDLSAGDVTIEFEAGALKDKLLALMPQGPANGSDPSALAQVVKIDGEPKHTVTFPAVTVELGLKICFADLEIPFTLKMSLNVRTLHFSLEAGEDVYVTGELKPMSLLGFRLDIAPKKDDPEKKLFKLSFANGDMSLSLAEDAIAALRYDRLSSDGSGLELTATEFKIGRGGLDLKATVADRPVRLGGLDQPFRFKSGSIAIKGGKLLGGTISGHGPMPPALIGEANAEIDLVFGQRAGRLALIAANAKLEKEGEPLYSTGTRFRITLDALGLAFREPEVGPVQFYFQLWGTAAFAPGAGEFDSGMLKNIKSVSIRLDGAPLTGNGRELMKHFSFLVELDPPVRKSLFDIFGFEIRGIAFYPASKAWPDDPPAIGLAGQISFLEAGDVISSEINIHELLISVPEPGGSVPLPRIRADGLSVLVRIGGIAQVEATAVAVDGSIPSLYAPVKLPANVSADGFLAAGRVDIVGLGAFGGAMGFLELRKEGISRVKHAMFLYGQGEKLTERIDTPIGPLFVREIGFGIGKNYTLTAIAAADEAKSPRELVKKLDEVSKLQGNLMNFNAWTPQFDKDLVTLALRGMISMAATSKSSASYDEKGERDISNPILMDIVLAIRTDLTFFANVRAWIAHNYHDWFSSSMGATFKERPTLRGYLYFSVPRKELLARFLSDKSGIIGKHPELPKELLQAIQSTRFSSTLYIRPGLYHAELGWPYELGFELGDRNGNFYLDLSGGLVLRIEDATMLYGVAFKASGHMQFGGQVGNANFGASAVARADFLLGSRLIAYIAPLDPRDTLFYGEIFLSVTLRVGVSIWMSFKIFRKRFTIRIGFSVMLTISVAAEVVLSGTGVGAKVHAAVGVRGFGRTLSVGVGFTFGANALGRARARVARFMDLGLGIDPPKDDLLHAPAPAPEVAREKRAKDADERLNNVVPQLPPEPPADPVLSDPIPGRPIGASNFWALLFLAESDDDNPTYMMVLVPKDYSDYATENTAPSTFFAEPLVEPSTGADAIGFNRSGVADYKIEIRETAGAIRHLQWNDQDQKVKVVTLAPGSAHDLNARLDKQVGTSELGALDLNALMAECFLGPPEELKPEDAQPEVTQLRFGEPYEIHHQRPGAAAHLTARNERLRQASRNIGNEKLEASLVAEEKRSALINKIGESAFEMAAEWRALGGVTDNATWTNDKDDLTAPDFGLSFLVQREDLNELFDEHGNNTDGFTLSKRVLREDGTWSFAKGEVTLFNHPEEAFSEVEPRLDHARVEVHQDGFRLYWDLEPAFGASEDMPFEKDPESLLAYYVIERSFEGTDSGWSAEFRTRTSTVMDYVAKGGGITVNRSRAQMHLCDDFSLGGVPTDLRALLVGMPIPSGKSVQEVWKETFGTRSSVGIVYKVTAVDIMGTPTGQRVIEHTLTRPKLRVPGPLRAELSVEYAEGIGTLGAELARPTLRLALMYAEERNLNEYKRPVFQLRIRGHKLKGGGQYGADAVDDSRNRPSQADIDAVRSDLDRDLYLAPVETGGIDLAFLLGELTPFKTDKFGVFESLEKALPAKSQKSDIAQYNLAKALRIPGSVSRPDDLRACRVFLRQLPEKPEVWDTKNDTLEWAKEWADNASPWLIAQTQLVVLTNEKRGQPFTATVELLETPLSVPFMAFDQRQIERDAGRLELVYPGAGRTFGDLVNNKEPEITLRRLDPDRRSAIRLDFNVSGSEMADMSGTGLEIFHGPELNGLIGGFDIFAVDPARLRMRSDESGGLTSDVVAEDSRKRATVKVLPRSLAGLFPDALPDFRSIDVRYPSDTLRTDPLRKKGRTRARWYSGAESLVTFPAPRLRRTLFPAPEEPMISALLDEFVAEEITVALRAPDVPEAERQGTWAKLNKLALETVLELAPDLVLSDAKVAGFALTQEIDDDKLYWLATPETKHAEGIWGHELRALLRSLVLKIKPEFDAEYAQWRRYASPEALATAFRVKVIVTTRGKEGERSESVEINLASPLHPVLADTLDALCFKDYGNAAGQVFRAYEVVREPVPPTESKGFEAFLDGHGPAGDPYGWSALRALGLASGFRLYSIDEGRFLFGNKLFKRVNDVFERAVKRYYEAPVLTGSASPDEACNLGHPFVELVDLPETFMAISSPDGRAPGAATDTARIADGDTSILQIGLRPRAGQQLGPGPVRYLAVKVKDKKEIEAEKLVLHPGAVYDFIGLPLAEGDSATRFADETTAAAVFPEGAGIPAMPRAALGQFRALDPGEVCFVLRVTQVNASFDFDEARQQLKEMLGSRGFDVTEWSEHPAADAPPIFDTFEALDPPLLAAVMGHRAGSRKPTSLDTLLGWLPPGHLPDADLTIADPGETAKAERIARVAPVAARVAEWTARFLAFGADQAGADTPDQPPIRFALAALTSEESFARVPDANGRVAAFFIDPSRVGREHYFAIRPFGRYAGIETMIGPHSERPVTLKDGLSNDWRRHFAGVAIDRSKPLEPPAILAARTGRDADVHRPGTIELIVARTPDQIASEANLIAERALQGGWTGLELRATYARTDHAARIFGVEDFDPFSGFNESDFGGVPQKGAVDVEILTPGQLTDLRSAAPDAWRGAIRYELSGLPHFFDTMALVHQSAGVVVSDVAALPLPRAGTVSRFPPFESSDPDEDVRKNDGWGIAERAVWHFGYVEAGGTLVAEIRFDLPMMRNLDLMAEQDLWAWTGGVAARVAPVYRLPNPETSYRVGAVSADFSAAAPQIEILPVKKAAPDASLYVARLAGDRFVGIQSKPAVREQPGSESWNWRLALGAKLSEDSDACSPPMPEIIIEGEGEFARIPDPFDPVAWARWAPERSFAFEIGADEIDQTDLDRIAAELNLFRNVPGVRAILDALSDPDLAKGARIAGHLPLGQAVSNLSGLQPVGVEIGPFVWPEAAEGLDGLTHVQYAAHSAAGAELAGDNPARVESLLTDLKARWLKLRQTGKGGTRARYEPIEKALPEAELAPPFAQFEMVRFSKTNGPLEAGDILALIEAVQTNITGDRYVAAQAVEILDALRLPAEDVTIPLPVGAEPLQVEDLAEVTTFQYAAGFHWLPDDAEMETLDDENLLGPRMYQLRREAVFGADATPRLTGFSGPGTATSIDIDQKGEPS